MKVIKTFRCKTTKQIFREGDNYEAEPERIEFLQQAGYLDTPPEKPKRKRKKAVEPDDKPID